MKAENSSMCKVLINCPLTDKPVYTGVKLPKDLLDSKSIKIGPHKARCLHCGQVHEWGRKEAYISQNGRN